MSTSIQADGPGCLVIIMFLCMCVFSALLLNRGCVKRTDRIIINGARNGIQLVTIDGHDYATRFGVCVHLASCRLCNNTEQGEDK